MTFNLPPLPRVNWRTVPADEIERVTDAIPFLDWRNFTAGFDWKQGEHVSLIGPTGGGKTFLGLRLLPIRTYAAIFATKTADATLTPLTQAGWRRIAEWPPAAGQHHVILWPPYRAPDYERGQIPVFHHAMADIFASGAWAVFVDEVSYFSNTLKLDDWLKRFWQQGRSLKISLVAATQRPAAVPLDMYSAATHIFLWRDNDRRNLDRLGEMGGAVDPYLIRAIVSNLRPFEVLYLNTRTGAAVRTRAE